MILLQYPSSIASSTFYHPLTAYLGRNHWPIYYLSWKLWQREPILGMMCLFNLSESRWQWFLEELSCNPFFTFTTLIQLFLKQDEKKIEEGVEGNTNMRILKQIDVIMFVATCTRGKGFDCLIMIQHLCSMCLYIHIITKIKYVGIMWYWLLHS